MMVFFLTTATIITAAKVVATVGSTLVAVAPFVDAAIQKRKNK